jgi:isoleucyl-tRNA synthetase
VLTDDAARHALVELAVDARAIGPRLGPDTQNVIRAVKAGDWAYGPDGGVRAAGIQLFPGEYTERMVAIDPENTIALHGNAGVVVLDLDVTPELAREGIARDVIRVVQQARRDAGLKISDRIALTLQGDETVADAVRAHEPLIAGEVLASSLTLGAVTNPTFTSTITGGARLTVQIDRP